MASVHRDVIDISKRITENNISLVIDVSGSMYKNFEVIKEASVLLINSLLRSRGNASFNIISFSNASNALSNSMIPCSKENLALATTWIHSLNCETNTNTLSALVAVVTAFNDDQADAVVIFTDGLPNQKPSVVLKCIMELSQGRPIHAIYVNNGFIDTSVVQFWEKLALNTNGSLHVLTSGYHRKSKSQQIYPYQITYGENCETDSQMSSDSSSSSSCFDGDTSGEESDLESEFSPKDVDDKNKLLGKVVLAKRRSNSIYYKGTIIKMIPTTGQVVVLFQSSKDVKFQLQQKCYLSDIVFFEDGTKQRIYTGDKVLVNLSAKKKRYIPGTVKKKEYLFDDDDYHGYDKLLQVELFDGHSANIPLLSAIRITHDRYDHIVEEMLGKKKNSSRKRNDDTKREKKKHNRHRSYEDRLQRSFEDRSNQDAVTKDYLKSKIEQQLRESEELLSSLNLKEQQGYYKQRIALQDDLYDSGYTDDQISYEKYKQMKEIRKSIEELYSPDTEEFHSGLIGRGFHYRTKSAEPKFIAPSPPTWKSNKKTFDRTLRSTRNRSQSVGSNVVERSKKHWLGRPISKETSAKKHTGRYRSKKSPPTAEEYVSADGVPFPVKTDRRLAQYQSTNWSPGQRTRPGYKHHDIIAHRVVDLDKKKRSGSNNIKDEYQENNRINTLQTNRELRELRQRQAKNERIIQHAQRDQQMRKEHEDQERKGYTKVKITIEKDASKLENKQRKYDEQRKYEKEREAKNQEKKYNRIDAIRNRKKNYPEVSSDKEGGSRGRKPHGFEQKRIDNQIEDHESKIKRLKQLRKNTDARLRHMKNENDRHRDITGHVYDVKRGHIRSEILP